MLHNQGHKIFYVYISA